VPSGSATPPRECVDLRGLRRALDLHPIHLRQLRAGLRDARLQPSVGREHDEPFAVGVEAPGRVDAGHVDVARERRARPSPLNWHSTP
jgi:hypothetical protein